MVLTALQVRLAPRYICSPDLNIRIPYTGGPSDIVLMEDIEIQMLIFLQKSVPTGAFVIRVLGNLFFTDHRAKALRYQWLLSFKLDILYAKILFYTSKFSAISFF